MCQPVVRQRHTPLGLRSIRGDAVDAAAAEMIERRAILLAGIGLGLGVGLEARGGAP